MLKAPITLAVKGCAKHSHQLHEELSPETAWLSSFCPSSDQLVWGWVKKKDWTHACVRESWELRCWWGSYLKRWICCLSPSYWQVLSLYRKADPEICPIRFGGGGWGLVCVCQGWCCLFFLSSLHRSSRQVPGDTPECWCSLSAFPAPSLLPRGVHLLLPCSHGLFLPRAKLILKVGQKGGKTIKRLRPPLLTHMGTAISEPEPSPASSTATKGMSQSVGHHLTPRLSQQPHRKMTWEVWVMM